VILFAFQEGGVKKVYIIGELINSTRGRIKKAIDEQDVGYIQEIARKQVENGADFVDVNAGAFVYDESKHLCWLVEVVQAVVDHPLALDSPSADALKAAIKVHRGTPLINSISGEKERYNQILPLVKEYNAKVVALAMDDSGMPDSADERMTITEKLLADLDRDGVPMDNVFVDPLIKPVSVNGIYGPQALETIERIVALQTGCHITCGLSNISFGLPHRLLLNQAFLVLAMGRGMDSAIADPLDRRMMSLIRAAEMVLNQDDYGMKYLKAARAGQLIS
jgi:5-methyltetrahydrofolate--homocysteine methyltransferase